jgi:hypothetical protein
MASFWEWHASDSPAPRPSSQNDLTGVCERCGFVSTDVLLGICADCIEEEA